MIATETPTVTAKQRPAGPTLTPRSHIASLLDDLPPDSLRVVEQFVEFLHVQAQRQQLITVVSVLPQKAPYPYPTVAVPASTLYAWTNLIPGGYEGDALADTEALYDEV
ncbi:MAG: hypothetical protein AB1791_10580 [Chloroflexota bacterium]